MISPLAMATLERLAKADVPVKAFPAHELRPAIGGHAVAAAAVALPMPPAKLRPQQGPRPEGTHHAQAAVPAVVAPRAKVDQGAPRQQQAKRPLPQPKGPPRQPQLRQVAAMEYNNEMFDLIADEPAKKKRRE